MGIGFFDASGFGPARTVQGLAIGLAIGLAGRAIVRSWLVGSIDLLDPWMLLTVPVPLILAAFFACDLPARRASKIDPSVALREL